MPAFSSIAMGVGGLAGGIGGALSGGSVPEASQYERDLQNMSQLQFNQASQFASAGVGIQDAQNAADARRRLAAMFEQAAMSGGLPGQEDITASNDIANRLFGFEREQLSQDFEQQGIQANRMAAQLGRSADDPILRAKLAQEQTRQSRGLAARQGGFAQQFALGLPERRLGFAAQGSDILSNLSQQAFQNRLALSQAGMGGVAQQQSFRLGQSQAERGGGFGGFLTGALGGAGAGLSAGASYQSAQNQQQFLNQFSRQPAMYGYNPVQFGYSPAGFQQS